LVIQYKIQSLEIIRKVKKRKTYKIQNYDQGWRKGVLKTMTKAGGKEY